MAGKLNQDVIFITLQSVLCTQCPVRPHVLGCKVGGAYYFQVDLICTNVCGVMSLKRVHYNTKPRPIGEF